MRHEVKEAGARERAYGQTDHPHQTFLVATRVDEGHDDGSSEGAETDDRDEQNAVTDARRQRDISAR